VAFAVIYLGKPAKIVPVKTCIFLPLSEINNVINRLRYVLHTCNWDEGIQMNLNI